MSKNVKGQGRVIPDVEIQNDVKHNPKNEFEDGNDDSAYSLLGNEWRIPREQFVDESTKNKTNAAKQKHRWM